ncbi:MAG: transcriptional regulator, partial [Alphaproteobacteria bacterium]
RGRQAQWRPCRLNGEGLKPVFDWVEEYRRFWEQSFDRLEAYLEEIQKKDASDERH